MIGKGKSLSRLSLVANEFDDCFVVNHFAREFEQFKNLFLDKRIVQFVNRRGTVRMPLETYREFGITEVQYNLPERFHNLHENVDEEDLRVWYNVLTKEAGGYCLGTEEMEFLILMNERMETTPTVLVDKKTNKRLKEYGEYGLRLVYLPEFLLKWNLFFRPYENYPNEYFFKHPNTGVQAVIYAAEIHQPERLFVVGLDFYQDDYLYRRDVSNPLDVQQKKIKRCHMIEHFVDVVKAFPGIEWHIVTNCDFPQLKGDKNVLIL